MPEQIRALVRKGEVVNVIVVDDTTDNDFFEMIRTNNDDVVDVTNLTNRPGLGWKRDKNGKFTAPSQPTPPTPPVDRPV